MADINDNIQRTLLEIKEAIGGTNVGIKNINRRLDLANGRTEKLEERVDDHDAKWNRVRGGVKLTSWIGGAVMFSVGIWKAFF